MNVANAAAATRGASAEFAVFASVMTCPDMCTPICAARYVISIQERLQLAFFALTLAPARSSPSKSSPRPATRSAAGTPSARDIVL
jgi:hypothetical protein